ncbi:lytic transglycosylase domain-containing protein [uncultured Roseovarius sp.]|uniref:lytic transglycosylase domain-containing protein n=1 Tax=uncultured Roseovarius sp. TaxID=293344 RepID=UPI002613D66B|nr:lytic transglycosylase domain-containing protein [uncultured Roseovarius sp.]
MKFLSLFLSAAILAAPLAAQEPKPFPDFTFKREKAPAAGARRKPLVQIKPDESRARVEPRATGTAPKSPRVADYGWFWTNVPPERATDSALRLRAAMEHLARPPAGEAVNVPRLQAVQAIALSEGQHILRETIGTQISPALVLAVIAVESSGRPAAVSGAGAQGLMQLMPDTARRFGVTDSLSPAQNIRGGVAYLNWLMGEFDGDVVLALAGYNAGENAVKQHDGVPPYAETRDYIPKVLAAYEVARGLCKTKPELITDACALNLALN